MISGACLEVYSILMGFLSLYRSSVAFGKLGELRKRRRSMQQLYAWQQQEASYMMLNDFSGKPGRGDKSTNGEEDKEPVNFEPEM